MCGPLKTIFNQIPPISHAQNWHEKPGAQATPKVGPVDNVWYNIITSDSDVVFGDVDGEVGCVDFPSAL